jgi:membrane associated rhomboid family serine protease
MPIRLTPAVKALAIACFAAFLVQQTADQFMGQNLLAWFGLIPAGVILDFKLWQLVTYSFLHADVMHLFLNLLMLVFIGGELEARWGTRKFLRYYFFCVVSAGLLYLVLQATIWGGAGLHTPMVGASGGLYGLLMAYGIIFGERMLLFMMMFPLKAKYFVWILAGVEFMTTVFSGRGGLSAAAHLGGMAAGFAYLYVGATLQIARKRRAAGVTRPKKARRKAGQHLKLIINNNEPDDEDEPPKTWH